MPRSPESLPQSETLSRLKLRISELSQRPVIGVDWNDSIKTAGEPQEAFDFLVRKGWLKEDYPEIKYPDDLSRLIDLKLLAQNLGRSLKETLADTSINRILSISPTSRCETNCVHCMANSRPNGNDLDYTVLEKADPDFFKIFTCVHFGVAGNPLIVTGKNSAGKTTDISDYMALLYKFGIRNFALDVKTVDNRTLETYRRVKQFFRSTQDASLTQRISFNLYSPNIYGKERPLDDLKAEFLPLLDESLGFAQRIVIISTGSFKYTKAHIFKTIKYLCEIMEKEGFHTVRQHFGKILYNDDPADKEAYLFGRKHLEPNILVFASRADAKKSAESELELFGKIMGVRTGTPEGRDLVPTYFIHKETGKKVTFEHGNTLNEGRWRIVRNKGGINRVDSETPVLPRSICPAFLTKEIFLDSSGKIFRCAGSYHSSVPIGNISQSWQEIFASMQTAHEKTSKRYNQNIPGLVSGSFNNWECCMER